MDISRINLERWKMYKKNAGAEDRGVQERTGHEPDEDQEMVSRARSGFDFSDVVLVTLFKFTLCFTIEGVGPLG